MEGLVALARFRVVSKRRLDFAVEVLSLLVAAGVLSLSAACTADDCLDVCLQVSRVYSMLMFLTCFILGMGRRLWPDADLVRTEAAISGLRWLLTGPLVTPAVYLQARSLKSDIWLRTFHFCCSGLCTLYIFTVAPLPLLFRALFWQAPPRQRHQRPVDRTVLPPPLVAARHERLELLQTEPPGEGDEESGERTCCICLDRPANAMALPCRHASTCEVCLLRLLHGAKPRCPVCRSAITSYDVAADASYTATFIAPPQASFDPVSKLPTCRPPLRSCIPLCCPRMCATSHAPMLAPS